MIVIFEGPQGVGKTMMVGEVCRLLDEKGIERVRWKALRGIDPIDDMHKSLDHDFSNPEVVYILDRFLLSEWVIYYYTGKWTTREEWLAYLEKLKAIDMRLESLGAIAFLLTTDPSIAQDRLDNLKKEDILGYSEGALQKWYEFIHRPHSELIHLVNDDIFKMQRNSKLIVDIIRSRLP